MYLRHAVSDRRFASETGKWRRLETQRRRLRCRTHSRSPSAALAGDRRRGAAAHSVSAAGAALRAACRMWPPLASRALPEPAGDGHVVALESRRQAARSPVLAIPAAALQSPVGQAASSKLQSPPLACRKRLVPSQTRSVCVSTCWRTCGGSLGRPTLRPFPTWSAAEPAVMPAPDVITIERGGERCFYYYVRKTQKIIFSASSG